MIRTLLLLALLLPLLPACTPPVALTSTMDDLVVFGIEGNTEEPVAFTFESDYVQPEKLVPHRKGYNDGLRPGHIGYAFDEVATLERMTSEFMQYKFNSLDPGAETRVTITVRDFAIEEYEPEGAGLKTIKALAGEELRKVVGARLVTEVRVEVPGEEPSTKRILATSQEEGLSGSLPQVHAKSIDAVNNKFLMLLNQHLEALGL